MIIEIFRTEKRLIRATLKSYEKTGSYVFFKLFKKAGKEYETQQRFTITLDKFEFLSKISKKTVCCCTYCYWKRSS